MPLSLRDLRPERGFRDATIDDSDDLYRWRCDAEDSVFWNGARVNYHNHQHWLRERLKNSLVRIWIWEQDGEPCGMVRVDSNGELAFHAEPSCDAVEMLRQAHTLAADYGGRLKASVDQADRVKIARLQEAGFELYPVKFLAYRP